MPNPRQRLRHPHQRIRHPRQEMSRTRQRIRHPHERAPHPRQEMRHPHERMRNPRQRMANPCQEIYSPRQEVPRQLSFVHALRVSINVQLDIMAKKKYDDLSKEDLIRLLQARDQRDKTKFGLVWEANEIERDKALNGDFVALDLIPDLSCAFTPSPAAAGEGGGEGLFTETKDKKSKPNPTPKGFKNLIIEGDNFDALRYLKMCFAGRVKCIYIDPPYNTGNKDFVYNDHFVDKEDLWRHSTWCEFMYQRLTLAKDLLRQDGVIFVSIDDNELHTLGMMMQRIFGEGNFAANIIWQKVFAPKNTAKHFSDDHEYIVVYCQNGNVWKPNLLSRSEEAQSRYKNPDDDPRGPWTSGDLQARNYYSAGTYPIECPSGRVIAGPGKGSYWRFAKEKFLELNKDKRIWWGPKGDGMPRLKRFLSEVKSGQIPQTLWTHSEVGHTQDAKKQLLATVEFKDSESVFSTPKPVQLIDRILRISTDTDDLILDFFAGSGTTAHAVHKLNQEDGGNRRVILVSSTEATADEPQKNLCRDVCATRVRRVIEGNNDTPGLGGDFAYLRTRRIAPGELTEIDHEQVWIALQLTHMPTIVPLDEKQSILIADHDEQRLIYLPHFRAKDLAALRKAVAGSPANIIYTWQPELIKSRLRTVTNVQIEAVPESLARRFGLRL